MASAGRGGVEDGETAPLKKMATPRPPPSRLRVTSLPGRRRLSGAVRDKQKEAPEGRSGRWRDCAAGAHGLPAGRPDAADPGEWVGWGKGRELSPLKTRSRTSPASCPAPVAPAALALPARTGSVGPPAAIQFCLCPVSPFLWGSGTAPSPRRRGARAPSQAPRASLRSTTGSFRLGSPRSTCHPLGSPRSSLLHTLSPS